MLNARGIEFKVGNKVLLEATSISFEANKFHVIMGSNGAGKTTLLRLLAGNTRPYQGEIILFDRSLDQYSNKELATRRAVLSQHYQITFPINVSDIVMMGRYPYYGNNPAKKDVAICKQAMQLMQVDEMAERDYNTLSGGEMQKVQMSRVLAQIWETDSEQKILFLDEPVSHLDMKYQHQLLQVAKDLCKKNVTVIAILHDINLALAFADRIIFMKSGAVVRDINNVKEINTALIKDVFDVQSRVIEVDGNPIVVF